MHRLPMVVDAILYVSRRPSAAVSPRVVRAVDAGLVASRWDRGIRMLDQKVTVDSEAAEHASGKSPSSPGQGLLRPT
jgi:hypothetical protein